jgi:transcriptional regulator with XRE-family HTH domain
MRMDDTAASRLAQNLRRLREQRGWSQQYLADVSGVPRATLANLESGDGNPTLSILIRVTGALGATIEQLLAAASAQVVLVPALDVPCHQCDQASIAEYVATSSMFRVERLEIERQGHCQLGTIPQTTRCVLICEVGSIIAVTDSARTQVRPHDALEIQGGSGLRLENPKSRIAVVYMVSSPQTAPSR